MWLIPVPLQRPRWWGPTTLAALTLAAGSSRADGVRPGPAHPASPQAVQVEQLVRSTRSWDGTPLPPLVPGQPEVTVLRITIPAGVSLPPHVHPVINAGVLLEGGCR